MFYKNKTHVNTSAENYINFYEKCKNVDWRVSKNLQIAAA